MISAIVEDAIEHLYYLSKCSEKRWVSFAQDPCDTESKRFGTHLDLSQ
jgi:hypothetical protein